jgi:Putative zinc-finger
MTCHDARGLFSALIDEVHSADERAAVDAHLETCADCRREFQRFRDTVALLRTVEPARAPAGFVDRVLEAARPTPWPRRWLRALFLPWPLKLPIEVAAIVLVTVGVVYVFRATPELQRAARLESTQPAVTEAPRAAISEPSSPATSQPQETDRARERQYMEKKIAATPPAARDEAEQRAAGLKDAPRDVDKRQDIDKQKEASRPAPLTESQSGAAEESARLPAAPPPESRADALQARRPATGSTAATSLAPPDVSGGLAVSDRDAALRGLAQLLARLGAVEDRRVDGDEGPIIELTIPREAYAEFARELASLGRWQPTREPAALPARIRVLLRITG